MISSPSLLTDLQREVTRLHTDLRARCDAEASVDAALKAQYEAARSGQRTALTYKAWREEELTNVAVAWVFACVFIRFLEDNALVETLHFAGPDASGLGRARDQHEVFFRAHPQVTEREYRTAQANGDNATAEGLIAWVAGQPNVSATIKRAADLKGDVDHFAALSFLQGLLVVLRDSGHPGLLVVLDEVETLQRVRADVREKSLNALRQLIDEIDAGRFPGLFLVITGTPAFFDGPQGLQKLPPLAQRLQTDFDTDSRFDNPRAPQIRLRAFDRPALVQVGMKVRDIFVNGSKDAEGVARRAHDALLESLADAVTGQLGGKIGIAPRIYLKKLVADLLDRIELHPDFDAAKDYRLTMRSEELTLEERNLTAAESVENITLDV